MKTVLITGAAGGLGTCMVREYLSRGYRVYGADIVRHPDTDELLEQAGGSYLFLQTDVTDTAAVQRMADTIKAEAGALDIIVNAAGIIRPESEYLIENFDIDGSIPLFDVNALGPLRVTKACLDLLRRGEEKLVINISSEAGSMTSHADYINRYDYCMSKAALNVQSVILQRYVKPEGIRVAVFHPGWMHTPMGGPNAPVDPADSAKGIADVAETLRHKPDSYMYRNYDGTERPW